MKFLANSELRLAVQSMQRKRRWHCAVAFWGLGAEALVEGIEHDNVKIICNLTSGGTNPNFIEKLPRYHVRQNSLLHAKVYLGDVDAIVSSANASANGLGFEGREQEGWFEAGCRTSDVVEIILWFKRLWEESYDITDDDIAEAKQRWADRQKVKPTLHSFCDFDVRSTFSPLLYWDGQSSWKPNKEAIVRQLGHFDGDVEDRIGCGVQVRHPLDREILLPGTWVLCGKLTAKGTPHSRAALEWSYCPLSDFSGQLSV